MHELDPASQAELDAIGDEALAEVVKRVRQDPSGRRQPQHRYTTKFQNPQRYVKVAKGERVWELRTNHYRALFITFEQDGKKGLFFIQVRDKRFWSMSECPWHK